MAGTTWTAWLPANAALYDLAPPPTGKRGRPALTGDRLGKIAALAKDADWQTVTVERYGRTVPRRGGCAAERNRARGRL